MSSDATLTADEEPEAILPADDGAVAEEVDSDEDSDEDYVPPIALRLVSPMRLVVLSKSY